MELNIIVNGITRTYRGDYHDLHTNDWNEIIRDMLDTAYSNEQDHAKS
jgi:hypothetical protein